MGATTAEWQKEIYLRASCSAAREDHGPPRVLTVREVAQPPKRGINPPIFLNHSLRPVKVSVWLPHPEGASLARRPAIFVPIWKAGTTTVMDALLPRWFNCSQRPHARCRGPHSDLSKLPSSHRAVTFDDNTIASFHAGPWSDMPEVRAADAADALWFTVVRDPLARFVSGWNERFPRVELPLCARELTREATGKRTAGRGAVNGTRAAATAYRGLDAPLYPAARRVRASRCEDVCRP